jgi:pyruvate formate-lyase activating enzyme-like uncharacterized protein
MSEQQLAQKLQTVLGEFEVQQEILHNLEELTPVWAEQLGKAQAEISQLKVEEGGETVYSGELSPGCKACKAGSWDCLFLTLECNLNCPFCCSPGGQGYHPPLSALGKDETETIANLHIARPAGISFSGGEVFQYFDRLRHLVEQVRREFPQAYLWVYTNGILATGEKTTELGELGLDEIRFNLAATGYRDPLVLDHVAQASRCIETVTVEIPAIPDHRTRLFGALRDWQNVGVRFLNLHELMYEPGSASATLAGPRRGVCTPDGHRTEIHPTSRDLTFGVMQEVQRTGLSIAVNDCSMQNKLRQVRGRRMLIGRFLSQAPDSSDCLDDAGLLATMCAFDEEGHHFFFRGEQLAEFRKYYPQYRFVKMWRVPPLSIFAPKTWLKFEEIL